MRLRCQLFGFACLAMSIAAPLSTAQAVPTNYTYTGNNYTSVTGSYTTSMSLTGTFTLSSALAGSLVNFDALPLVTTFTAFDGLQTFTPGSPPLTSSMFRVNTNAGGDIIAWAVLLFDSTSSTAWLSCHDPAAPSPTITAIPNTCDNAWVLLGIPSADQGEGAVTVGTAGNNFSSPGIWTSAAAPEPSAALLVASALVGLASARRRARQ